MARPIALERIAAQEAPEAPLALDTLVAVVEALRSVTPLATICKTLDLSEDEIFKIVTGLGTWLIHAHGAAPGDITYAANQTQLAFFQPDGSGIVVPLGFDRRNGRRHDVSRSIRAIIVHDPDVTELSRYIDRQFPTETFVPMSGREIYAIWFYAQHDLLGRLHEGATSKAWATIMLEAYDLLDVSLGDAHAAARQIVSADKLNLDELEAALNRLSWLNATRVRKLTDLLAMCHQDPSDASMRVLEREVSLFTTELRSRPNWLAATIADLAEGQVKLLVERNGLGQDPDTRKIELEIRRRLAEMGLKRDFDLLVPDGVRATLQGSGDVFWSALEQRFAGDSDWRTPLDDVLDASI